MKDSLLTGTMCTYSFISYAFPIGTRPKLLNGVISGLLNNKAIGLPPQDLLWAGVTDVISPASAEATKDSLIDWNTALIFVCRETGTGDYTVVVRGTNPFSWPSWKLEDLDTGSKVPWTSEADPTANLGSISKATSTALATHLGLMDGEQNLFTFLDAELSSINTLSFTGHSLGGCVAPVLALKYKEHLESQNLTVPPLALYAYAGPSPGDSVFADYMTKSFKYFTDVSFVRDTKDIVPHIWNRENMAMIGDLYTLCPATKTINHLLKFFDHRVKDMNYEHAFPGFESLIMEEVIHTIFGLDSLKSAARNEKLLPLIKAATASFVRNGIPLERNDSNECGDTIRWFIFAICMHVLPYLSLCGSKAEAELLDTVIKPHYFQGILG